MLTSKILKSLAVATAVLGLVGCASSGSKYASNSDRARAIGDVAHFYGEDVSPAQEKQLQATNTIFFGFDRYDITPESKLVLFSHAKKLLENPGLRLRIAGHTDERGSAAYNVGLSERRAKAAANILALKGVPEDQYTVVAFGKEKPVSLGHDESSWKLNRRDELAYEDS